MASRPWTVTKIGALIGVLATLAWVATFQPHGGVELSVILFPLWNLLGHLIFPEQSVPACAWFAGALLHWPALGAVVDLLMTPGRRPRVDSPPN